jgi:peptidoglycan lytic transglycosylase
MGDKFMRKDAVYIFLIFILVFSVFPGFACAKKRPVTKPKVSKNGERIEYGKASWYGKKFHGRKTASGERYNMYQLTAAHKTLPFGTKVKVTNMDNGKSVVVRINDRGPFVKGRIIDLSRAAAKKVDMINAGVAFVKVEIIK